MPHKKAIYFMNSLCFVISFCFFPGASAGPLAVSAAGSKCTALAAEDMALPQGPWQPGALAAQHCLGLPPPQFLQVFPVVMGSETDNERECPIGCWPPSMRASSQTARWRRGRWGQDMEMGSGILGRESDLHAESHHHSVQMAAAPSSEGHRGYIRC